MCGAFGGTCVCKVARWLSQTGPMLTNLTTLSLAGNNLEVLQMLYIIQNPYLNHLNHLDITSPTGRCSNPARVQYTLRRTTCQVVQQHRWCGGGRDCIANAHHLIVLLLLNLCRCCHILCGSCLLWNTSTSLGTTWLNCLKKLQI